MRRGNISNRLAPLVLISLNLVFKQNASTELSPKVTSITSMLLGVRRNKPVVESNRLQELDKDVIGLINRIYVKTDYSIGIVTVGLTQELVDMYRTLLKENFVAGRIMNFATYMDLRDYVNSMKLRTCVYIDSDLDNISIVGNKAMTFEAFKTEI